VSKYRRGRKRLLKYWGRAPDNGMAVLDRRLHWWLPTAENPRLRFCLPLTPSELEAYAERFCLPLTPSELEAYAERYGIEDMQAFMQQLIRHGTIPQVKNGATTHPLYPKYESIMRRVRAGKGVVSLRWALDFRLFCMDVGRPETPGARLCRVDANKPFEAANMRWI
jgi:hypothetical protein